MPLHSLAGSSVFPPLYPITRDAFSLVYGGLKALSWKLYAVIYFFFVRPCEEVEKLLLPTVPAAPGGLLLKHDYGAFSLFITSGQ